ncbi:MAG TPA: hypothetical protein VEK11_22315 [Thermoanaerobaculia bacterium]|nr:hypothetical protein [Thermoanaerobaculia bacterium]
MPGETVALRNGLAFVNGMDLDEPYAWIDEQVPANATVRNVRPLRPGAVPRRAIRSRVVLVVSQKSGVWRP